MDRTEASIAPARGGDRTPEPGAELQRRSPRWARARVLARVAAPALVAVLVPGAPASPAAAAATGHADHMTLVRQSPWVGPNAPNQDLTMGLVIHSDAPSAALKLSFTVYDPLTTRSGFDETLSGRGLGVVRAQSPAMGVSAFTTDAQGVTRVTIPVDGDSTPAGTGNWTADLRCRPGSCADVYPLKVTLTDSAPSGPGAGGAQLVTYLVYEDPSPGGQPLRLALVIPLGLSPPVADGQGQVPDSSPSAIAGLEGLAGEVGSAPTVPVTLEPDAASLAHLAAMGRAHTVSQVAALSASSVRQTLSGPYAAVDAGALVGGGLGAELRAQLNRGAEVLASPALGVHATKGTWVARTPLDQAAVDRLAPDYGHLVVPQGSVSGPTGPLTTTQPFTLSSSGTPSSSTATPSGSPAPGGPVAVVSDPGLGARLVGGKGTDATLAAVQLLAETSLIYYEVPNLRGPGGTPAPRGVVAVAPLTWDPTATFVSTVLADLQDNPVIRPVTLDQLFSQVPVGADNQALSRRPLAPVSTPALPVRALRAARARQQGFQSAVAGASAGADIAQSLGDLLLAAESSMLSNRQQQVAVAGFEAALDRQLQRLSVRTDTIRLTAGAANVPITLLRNTTYPVTVVVKLTSDKLRFPRVGAQVPGALCRSPRVQSSADRSSYSALCTLDHSTNAMYVNMQSRASGDFQITVALTSPDGNLVLAGGQLTVRSLSTSAVAIALSVGAALVLLAWWGRTLWRGTARRGAHALRRVKRAAT